MEEEIVYAYKYNSVTGEYIDKEYARLDPEATKIAGRNVYLLPPNCTLEAPPELGEHRVAIFQNGVWVVENDYRGEYICDEFLNIQIMQVLGNLPEGFIFITKAQAEKITEDYLWYIVQDGELIRNPNYEEQKAQEHKDYVSRLAMTKYDFYKFICVPNDISYSALLQMVSSNEEIAAAWNLCGHVYRGDATLCRYISQFLPAMTEEVLDTIFEEHGKIINE